MREQHRCSARHTDVRGLRGATDRDSGLHPSPGVEPVLHGGEPVPVPVPHVPPAVLVRDRRTGAAEPEPQPCRSPVVRQGRQVGDGDAQGLEMVGRHADHGAGHPVLAEPRRGQQGVLACVHPGRVPRQRDRHQGQPVQPAPDHVRPQSRVRVVLLHLQRVEPDHPAPATHLGPGVGDRGGRQLRRDPRGRQGRLRLPGQAVPKRDHIRHQPAVGGGVRAVASAFHRHVGQGHDGSEPGVRRADQANAQGVRRSPVHAGHDRVQRAQGCDLGPRCQGGFRVHPSGPGTAGLRR